MSSASRTAWIGRVIRAPQAPARPPIGVRLRRRPFAAVITKSRRGGRSGLRRRGRLDGLRHLRECFYHISAAACDSVRSRFTLSWVRACRALPAWYRRREENASSGGPPRRSQKAGSAWRPAYRLRTLRHSARPPATLALPSLPLSLRPTPQRPPPSPLALPSLPCS